MNNFLKDVWYIAGWSNELGPGKHLARTIADTPVVIYRDENGELAALYDRCPHRFAPLSNGKIVNGVVECGYHGLRFDRTGACVGNPHGPISRYLAVDAYAVHERHGFIWLWLGEPSKADPDRIADMSAVRQEPAESYFSGYLPVRAHHLLLVDNILDLSHADYLHQAELGSGGTMSRSRPHIEEGEDWVMAQWFVTNEDKGVAILRAELDDPTALVDMWTEVRWHTSGAVMLKVGITPTGESRERGVHTHVVHAMTPETATSTHYFYSVWRNYKQQSAEYSRMMQQAVRHAFENEDKPMMEAQQRVIGAGDFMKLKPGLLPIDAASTRARRLFDRAVAAESARDGLRERMEQA